jgi:hypothetical protein
VRRTGRRATGQVLAGGIGRARRDLPVGRLDPVIADQIDHAPAALRSMIGST